MPGVVRGAERARDTVEDGGRASAIAERARFCLMYASSTSSPSSSSMTKYWRPSASVPKRRCR